MGQKDARRKGAKCADHWRRKGAKRDRPRVAKKDGRENMLSTLMSWVSLAPCLSLLLIDAFALLTELNQQCL